MRKYEHMYCVLVAKDFTAMQPILQKRVPSSSPTYAIGVVR